MILKIVPGVDCISSVSKMGIPTAFFRSAAGPVLDHGVNTVIAPAIQYLVISG